jgi:hypothetical protein
MKPILVLLVTLCACTNDTALDTSSTEQAGKRHPDAAIVHDAARTADAALGTSPGVVSCYADGSPNAVCFLSVNYCCFDNYSSSDNGYCTTSCLHSDEHCDGQEDCPTGDRCYAHLWNDGETNHWTISCQATPTDPSDYIMCHPNDGTCPTGTTCTQANPNAMIYDFATPLYVCF